MKKSIFCFLTLMCCLHGGCVYRDTSEHKEQEKEVTPKYNVTLYSGGVVIKNWVSDGEVYTRNGSSYFMDSATKKHVGISGTTTAEEL